MSGVRLTWRQPQLQTRQLHPLTSLSSKRSRRDANGLTICSLVEWNRLRRSRSAKGCYPNYVRRLTGWRPWPPGLSRPSFASHQPASAVSPLWGKIVPMPLALSMDRSTSRPDRIRWILRNSAAVDALLVHARSQIARARADYELFSKMS
jgi:hypothetical protein